MTRRLLDIVVAGAGLLTLSIPLAVILFLVWRQDRHSPFYIADRAGLEGKPFQMVKIRSMIVNADRSGVESTSATDNRITPLGHFIRRWKIDELSQLWNVLKGDMSLVGPRPNTMKEVATYSQSERGLLTVQPGITDFSSIVFSDEGDILKDSVDPDGDYARLIRPWKSKLGLVYVANKGFLLNLMLIVLTVLAVASKPRALFLLQPLLKRCGTDIELLAIARRDQPLVEGDNLQDSAITQQHS
jgi:lipopolysaccharide/colanic/teichoic acid biosynthesis glycosyltransferase